jgi:hypothetical protein
MGDKETRGQRDKEMGRQGEMIMKKRSAKKEMAEIGSGEDLNRLPIAPS